MPVQAFKDSNGSSVSKSEYFPAKNNTKRRMKFYG
jgi:hypothetical protein